MSRPWQDRQGKMRKRANKAKRLVMRREFRPRTERPRPRRAPKHPLRDLAELLEDAFNPPCSPGRTTGQGEK